MPRVLFKVVNHRGHENSQDPHPRSCDIAKTTEGMKLLKQSGPRLLRLGVFIAPLVVSSIFMALSLPRFQTTDDISMILIASGVRTGSPSADLVFTSEVFGSLMAWLYSLNSSVSWWAWLQVGSVSVALGALNLLVLDRRDQLRMKVPLLIAVNLVALPLVLALNFSQPAILCAAIGTLLMLVARDKGLWILGLGLAAAGIAWRPEGAVLGLVISFGLILVSAITERSVICRAKVRRWLIGGLAVGTLFLLLETVPGWIRERTDTRWAEFLVFNRDRGALDGAGNFVFSPEAAKAATSAGMSPNDWNLLIGWFFQDRQVYSEAALSSVAGERASFPQWNSIPRLFGEFLNVLSIYPVLAMVLALVLVSAILGMNARNPVVVPLQLTTVGVILFGVFLYGRLPERVAAPALIATMAIVLVITAVKKSDRNSRTSAITALSWVVALAALVFSSHFIVRWADFPAPNGPAFSDLEESGSNQRPVNLLTTTYFATRLLSLPANFDPKLDVTVDDAVILDWWQRSPAFEDRLSSLGLSLDVMESVYRGDARLITSDPNFAVQVCSFMIEHALTTAESTNAELCRSEWVAVVD